MKRSIAIACCWLLILCCSAFAQAWVKSYGTTGFEYGYNIYPAPGGGFIALGTQSLNGLTNDEDFWAARFDSAGNRIWDKRYGTPGIEETLFGSGVARDGGFMFGGFTGKQFSGTESAHMFRIDTNGNVKWEVDINYSLSDHFHSFTERKTGGYYFSGHTDSKGDPNGDMWLLRLGPNRDTIWNKVYDRGTGEHAHWSVETRDGDYLMLGHTASGGREKYWLMRVDSNGTTELSKVYGSNANYHDSPYRVFETAEGNYAMIGGSSSATTQGLGTMWLLVVDTAGRIVIDKHYGNATSNSFSQSGRQTSDGGYILSGFTNYQTNGREDMYIVKTDAAGNVEWEENYGGSNPDYGYDVEEFSDSYVAVGYTASSEIMTGGGGDLMMVKIMKPAAPLAPVLLAPRNDSLNVPVAATLRWQGSGGATRYRMQVATDNLFTNLVFDDSTVSGTSRAIASLQSSTRYYWRIQAINATGTSPWSEVWSFTTREPIPLPATVALKSPLANATIPGTAVLLVWRTSGPEVTRYWLEYSTDSTFATRIVDSTLTDTTATRTGLIAGQRYWWRVRAANSSGWGGYSETRSFEVFQQAGVPGEVATTGARLFQNSPNPFTAATTIRFALASRSQVNVQIIDLVGREVATVVDEERSEGEYAEQFDGSDLPSGVYLARLSVTTENGAKSVETVSITVTR